MLRPLGLMTSHMTGRGMSSDVDRRQTDHVLSTDGDRRRTRSRAFKMGDNTSAGIGIASTIILF